MTRLDPMFVECIKEELRAGNDMTIRVANRRDIPRWKKQFTPLELRHLTFEVMQADGGRRAP